jgi:hypothetical protein
MCADCAGEMTKQNPAAILAATLCAFFSVLSDLLVNRPEATT